jgi:hypothetical protein
MKGPGLRRPALALLAALLPTAAAHAQEAARPVDTSLHGLPLRTTVDSELAQYCLTDYLQGRRTRPELDSRLEAARQRLAASGPTRDTLLEIARSASPDTATALFADRLLADTRNHALRLRFEEALAAVQRGDAPLPLAERQDVLILLAPGWLYVTQPETGADFARARRVLDAQGLRHELLRTHESGTIEENARIIADAILRRSGEYRALVLVSASKAGPEVGEALSLLERGQHAHNARAWVNIGGILQGSPLADWAARWPQRGAVGLLAPFKGWTLASVDSMRTVSSMRTLFRKGQLGAAAARGELSRRAVLRRHHPRWPLRLPAHPAAGP